MNIFWKTFFAAALFGTFASCIAYAADPTQTPAALADAMREQINSMRQLSLAGLVVGGKSRGGVAIVRQENGRTTTVRAGQTVTLTVNDVPLALDVKSVSERGIEISAPTLEESVFVAGSFLPAEKVDEDAELRYVEINDLDMGSAAKLIADQSGKNAVVSPEAAKSKVSVFLRDVSAEKALDALCSSQNLWCEEGEVTRIVTMSEHAKALASFRDEETVSFTMLYPNVIEAASIIYGLYPNRVRMTLGEQDILDDEENDIARRFERFRVIDDASSSTLLEMNPGSVSSSSAKGGAAFTSYGDEHNFNLEDDRRSANIRALTSEDAKALENARAAGNDAAAEQILSTYREAAPSIFVTVSRRNNMIIVRSSDRKAMAEIRELVRRIDVPTPMVLLEMKIFSVSLSDGFNSTFEYEFNADGEYSGNQYRYSGGFPGFTPLASAAARSDAMSFQVLSEYFNARIQLLESEGRAKVISTPTLLVANNEVSRIFSGEEVPIVKNIKAEPITGTVGDVTTTVAYTIEPEIDWVGIGTTILFTPSINADRSVTLRILEEESTKLEGGGKIPYGQSSASATLPTFRTDTVLSTRISGTFVAQDRQAVAIGGLVTETDSKRETRLPILGHIPLIGWLFRSTEIVKSRNELVILIRPHVIVAPGDAAEISRNVMMRVSDNPAVDNESRELDKLEEIAAEKKLEELSGKRVPATESSTEPPKSILPPPLK